MEFYKPYFEFVTIREKVKKSHNKVIILLTFEKRNTALAT